MFYIIYCSISIPLCFSSYLIQKLLISKNNSMGHLCLIVRWQLGYEYNAKRLNAFIILYNNNFRVYDFKHLYKRFDNSNN